MVGFKGKSVVLKSSSTVTTSGNSVISFGVYLNKQLKTTLAVADTGSICNLVDYDVVKNMREVVIEKVGKGRDVLEAAAANLSYEIIGK